jgi:hypothetical protein
MADEGQRVKIYKPDEADSNEKVSTKRATPMIGTILGLVLLIRPLAHKGFSVK